MQVISSAITYAGGQLYFNGFIVTGFRSLKVNPGIKVTVYKNLANNDQVKAMRKQGIKVTRIKGD